MALVTSKELMLDAQKNHYAIGAFNVENMEMVQAVIAAAEELRSPVILQTTPGTLKYAPPELFYANVSGHAGLNIRTLKATKSTVNRFVFFYADFCHGFRLPSLAA